jgi:hypothetical protein
MPSPAASFHATWRIGRRVQEVAAPRRKGSVRTVLGVGANAVIVVSLDGRPPANFRPAQLTPL